MLKVFKNLIPGQIRKTGSKGKGKDDMGPALTSQQKLAKVEVDINQLNVSVTRSTHRWSL